MNSPPSSEENNISKSIWVGIEKKKKKEKNTDPLRVARKCIRTESQRHGDFFPENDSS